MKVRGERECQDCGTRWTYYETGSIACPDCGSIHSVGIDERTEHTDSPATLDLTPIRNRIDTDSTREIAGAAADHCREYTRERGFINAGELRSFDEAYVAAVELQHIGAHLSREMRISDPAERYFYELLGKADDGDRVPVEEVPTELSAPFGLAMAAAVDQYQRDVRTYLDTNPEPTARRLSGRIRDHRKRIEALDGNVDPADANRLVHATRDLGSYINGDESAFVRAENWLAGIEDDTV